MVHEGHLVYLDLGISALIGHLALRAVCIKLINCCGLIFMALGQANSLPSHGLDP